MNLIESKKILSKAFRWGVLATVAMSIIMIIGKVTGLAPMPKPIPLAIIGKLFGSGTPLLMILAIASHLVYGGIWGAILSAVTKNITIFKGIVLGIFLWLIMQLLVLPFLGWGVFGIEITPKIAVATFVLHLLYGWVFGWGFSRQNNRIDEITDQTR